MYILPMLMMCVKLSGFDFESQNQCESLSNVIQNFGWVINWVLTDLGI